MSDRNLLDYRKDPRFVATVPLVIVIATTLIYYFVQRANELSPQALSSRLLLFVLWNINLVLILGILFVLIRVGVKLVLERQRGILGSRFRTKLVATYLVTSLLPILLLFFVATDLLRISIDRWFNPPVRKILSNSENIAQAAQSQSLAAAAKAAEELRDSIDSASDLDAALSHIRKYHPVDVIGAYKGTSVVKLLADPRSPVEQLSEPPATFFEEVRRKGSAQKIELAADGKWLRFGVRTQGSAGDVAMAAVFLPSTISRRIDENIIAYQNFQQLDLQRSSLKASQTSILMTVTISILFGVLWLAIYVSRRITVPVQALAEGTRTLADGDYSHRIGVTATDEFGMLIDSFNSMAGQLESQRHRLTDSNLQLKEVNERLDSDRGYLSTVLESVSTGIVAFTDDLALLSMNGAAQEMLHLEAPRAGAPLLEIFSGDLAPIGQFISELATRDPRSREITLIRGGELRYLEISAARLKGPGAERGWVVALEETTQLVQAQKLAAWSEAARRIAHEIKNPLTPIQLSAERIAKNFRAGDPNLSQVIEEGCRTIVDEVTHLKGMVDEFSRFARMPAVHLELTSVAPVLDEVARLYSAVKPGVGVQVQADPGLKAVLDPEQIRRALINLLDNAVEATEQGTILLSASGRNHHLVLAVSDPGRGIPDADKEKLFLPHFSTKGRGTGLGLAIVHRIVHDHDGRISVHANHPRGTRFEIEIPA